MYEKKNFKNFSFYTWLALTSRQPPLLRTMLQGTYLLQLTFGAIEVFFGNPYRKKIKLCGAKCRLQKVRALELGPEQWRLVRCDMTSRARHGYKPFLIKLSGMHTKVGSCTAIRPTKFPTIYVARRQRSCSRKTWHMTKKIR